MPFLISNSLSLAFILALLSHAPATRAEAPGLTTAEFLKIEVGSRAAAMAGAHTSVSGDLFALHYNPASIASLRAPAVAFQYNKWFGDIDQNYVSVGSRFGEFGVLAASLNWLSYGDLRRTTVTSGAAGTTLGNFSARDYAVSLTWARGLSSRVDAGITAKIIGTEIDRYSGTTFAADAGLRYAVQPNWNVGASILNVGGDLELDRAGSPLPLGLRGGTSLALLDGSLLLSLDLSGYRGEDLAVGVGAEYTFNRLLSLRLGYDSRNDDAGEGLTCGAGFHYRGLDVDYAFTPFGDLGNSHRISLAYSFDGVSSGTDIAATASPASSDFAAPAPLAGAVGLVPAPTELAEASTSAAASSNFPIECALIEGASLPQAGLLLAMTRSRLTNRLKAAPSCPDGSARAAVAILEDGSVFLALSLYSGEQRIHTIQTQGDLANYASIIDQTSERLVRYMRTGDETLRFAARLIPATGGAR